MSDRKNLGAHTRSGIAPAYISVNQEGGFVTIIVRGAQPAESFHAPHADITMSRGEFAVLLIEMLQRFQSEG